MVWAEKGIVQGLASWRQIVHNMSRPLASWELLLGIPKWVGEMMQDGRRREVKRFMKHVKVLSTERPARADETAWVELKNIFGPLKLRSEQATWLLALIDSWLQH